MPSTEESKSAPLTTTQTEKPIHYTYLKEFRVEQCPLFLQHKCTQHKPFTCFYWHFMNQRRRRPVRKRDGTFNYSPDVYCTKYDETTGLCPDGDECLYLHRTAGDTERRYHLRYYKTGVCVYDTDSRGYCVKNGPHCAFAHGIHDLRNPVYDVRELQALDIMDDGANGTSGPNSLDKERNALNEDPKWQDSNYVLTNYKTESCKRPPRLCRQGYACPQFHNNRDRRRSPKKYKYRSTPCPNVKQGDEWGDPANCDSGDLCPYCHTRTEQQFHPEIYKSTKCNDIQQTGYCPRGPFCAFAHVDKELSAVRDIGLDNTTNLAAILSNALPSSGNNHSSQNNSNKMDHSLSDFVNQLDQQTTHANTVISQANTESSIYSLPGPVSRPRSYSTSTNHSGDSISQYHKAPGCEREDKEASIRRQLQLIDSDPILDPLEKARRKQNVYISHGLSPASLSSKLSPVTSMLSYSSQYYPASDTVESVVGNALDDLNLDGINVEASLEKELEMESNNSIRTSFTNAGLLGSSAPVTIPGSGSMHDSALASLSPTLNSPLGSLSHSLGLGANSLPHRNSIDKTAAAFYGHASSFGNSRFGHFSTGVLDAYQTPQNMSPGSRMTAQSSSPLINSINYNNSTAEVQRLRDELSANRARMMSWEESMAQARTACEVWKREAEDANRREKFVEQQRNDALVKISTLQKEVENKSGGPYLRTLASVAELETLPLNQLKHLQEQLRNDLDKVDKVVFHHTASKCMVCEEHSRSVSLMPCSHLVVCGRCASLQNKCPYCQAEVTHWTNVTISL